MIPFYSNYDWMYSSSDSENDENYDDNDQPTFTIYIFNPRDLHEHDGMLKMFKKRQIDKFLFEHEYVPQILKRHANEVYRFDNITYDNILKKVGYYMDKLDSFPHVLIYHNDKQRFIDDKWDFFVPTMRELYEDDYYSLIGGEPITIGISVAIALVTTLISLLLKAAPPMFAFLKKHTRPLFGIIRKNRGNFKKTIADFREYLKKDPEEAAKFEEILKQTETTSPEVMKLLNAESPQEFEQIAASLREESAI